MKEPNATQIASLYTCSVTPSPSLTSIMLKHTPAGALEKKLKEEMEQKKMFLPQRGVGVEYHFQEFNEPYAPS